MKKPFTFLAKSVFPIITAVVTKLDDEAWRFLKPHENKTVCFEIVDIMTLYFQIRPEGLEVIDTITEKHPNVTFKGTIASFVAMIFQKKAVHQDLHIRGDLECAKALFDTWQYLDCDFEGAVADFTHPTFAHGLFEGLRRTKAWGKETAEHRAEDLTAYLQSEKGILPTQQEVEAFIRAVEKCRDDVERLEAKIALHLKGRSS
jgi:ubiquinone biosynthesis protein UbiJ